MSALNDLVKQIANPELRNKIQDEISKLVKQKKFGLVFEEHLPETTVLYDIPVKAGAYVSLKSKSSSMLYKVLQIVEDKAKCADTVGIHAFSVSELVTTAKLGEPIYPYLKKIDECCNAPDSPLWHTLIEAENYHALQLLVYLYSGKVDCIYIDPPYNTGAKDWKYNNDYVDSNDAYRHSKWLSMMKRRLELAKKLLNPKDSVLIITIDEKEYLHLGCLIEDLFASANIQMVSTCINPKGSPRTNAFYRTDEYIYFIKIGDSAPVPLPLNNEWLGNIANTNKGKPQWATLLRGGTNSYRKDRPNMFYPIYVTKDGNYAGVGDPLPIDVQRQTVSQSNNNIITVWPLHDDLTEGRWQVSKDTFVELQKNHFVKLGKPSKKGVAIYYLKEGERIKVKNGSYSIKEIDPKDNSYILDNADYKPLYVPSTQWQIRSHNASSYGSSLLNAFFGKKIFSFPKSLYAVKDALNFFVANKPNALILDFFAGSGTTQHAVELLNYEDNGHRRCISVTNNEISDDESKIFKKNGVKQGDPEWESHGIARYVTWPRICSSIKGVDVNREPLKGEYGCDIDAYQEYEGEIIDPDTDKKIRKKFYQKIKQPAYPKLSALKLSEGFKTNAVFFKLGFLDKNQVALGQQLQQLTSILWLKAGAIGNCPEIENPNQDFIIFPKNKFAVLIKEKSFPEFINELNNTSEITTVYIVTDSQSGYKEMISHLPAFITNSYQLYSDYLDNFRIISGR